MLMQEPETSKADYVVLIPHSRGPVIFISIVTVIPYHGHQRSRSLSYQMVISMLHSSFYYIYKTKARNATVLKMLCTKCRNRAKDLY